MVQLLQTRARPNQEALSRQPFLQEHFQLGPVSVGAFFMLDGFVYAVFSPFWGWTLDKKFSSIKALAIGNLCVVVGYSLLGPLPFLGFLPKSLLLVGIGMTIHG